ncbi:MAG: DUF1273 family protein [Alistipes sp.]|nr:DUF1273 family protein [Alistipes sp.]
MIDRHHTVTFTGHRTYCGEADEALRQAILRLVQQGYTTFLSGMALGFDLAAAELVLQLRREGVLLRLVAVIPFRGQESSYSDEERARYARVVAEADEVITLAEQFHRGAYQVRNDYLVSHASYLVAWYNGSKGGTQYTFLKGLKCGLELENLATFQLLDQRLFQ